MKKNFFKSKSFKYGSNSIVMTIIVIAIAVVVNMFATLINYKADLTPEKLYSVSDFTTKTISKLDKDVTIYGLFDEAAISNDNRIKEVTRLLEKYKSDKLKVEYIDPDKNVTILNQLNPNNTEDLQKGDFVVKCGSKTKVLTVSDLFEVQYNQYTGQQSITGLNAEQAFTGALTYVTSEFTPTIYFLEGHDETELSKLTYFTSNLKNNNYDTKSINLMTVDKIPDDAKIIMAVSPKKDLTAIEADKLAAFFKDGGNGVFLFDSPDTATPLPQFEKILETYNVGINYDRVKENDGDRHVNNQPDFIYPIAEANDINGIYGNDKFFMLMPKSRSVSILKNSVEWIKATPLLKTSDKAVGDQIDATKQPNAGPLNLGIAVENTGNLKPSKMLVFGNAVFMTDTMVQAYGAQAVNGLNYILNAMSWMIDKGDDLAIPAKSYDTGKLQMTQSQAYTTIAVVLVIIPLLIFIYGVIVWNRRRHL